MRARFRLILSPLILSAVLVLPGCKSAEQKAEDYFQSGMQLLAAGDEDRAMVEFRNVFKHDGFHKQARQTYADLELKRGSVAEAYAQYLRLIEQYPDTAPVRQALAEIAIARGDWEEASRHGQAAITLAPQEPDVMALQIALDYRDASLARDAAARDANAVKARALLASVPQNQVARRVVIDHLIKSPRPQDALADVDAALKIEPASLEFNMLKLQLLAQAGDAKGSGDQLRRMVDLFPDNADIRTALIGWLMEQRDFDGAEAFLRKLAGEPTSPPEWHMAVVQMLQTARGEEAALAELDALIGANKGEPNADLYAALRATLIFQSGRQEEGLSAMQSILAASQPSDQTRRIKAMLAKMLIATGKPDEGRRLVSEVLAEDATNVEGLKMRAAWLVDDDKPGEAIVDLRTALDQNPRDAETLTLMAQAHQRAGSVDLAGEQLALAVEVSGGRAAEALRYAGFLVQQGRSGVAEAVLVDARRVNPTDPDVLRQLADLYLQARNWPGAQDVASTLRALGTDEARQAAQDIQAALLLGQDRTDDRIAFLEAQVGADSGDARTVAMILQAQIRGGKIDEARRYLDEARERMPDDAALRLLDGNLHALAGDFASAESVFRELIAADATHEAAVRLLFQLLVSTGREAEAKAVIDAALKASPASVSLQWIKAGALERSGDIEGAIAVYEALYAENSNNMVVANNLASLIAAHREDAASLDRAFTIARRLNGSTVPEFQDTYGWIEYRRGNLTEALANLQPAAAGLPDDALTQFHLGMTYLALQRPDDAVRVLQRAITLGEGTALPQLTIARDALKALPAPAL